jgi:hypothetical protein
VQAFPQTRVSGGLTSIVEAKSIDDGVIFFQAEQARLRIALLRSRRKRAHFNKAEAKREHLFGYFRIFVEPRGEADR